MDDFRQAGDAILNLVLSTFLHSLAQGVQKKHKIPFINLHDILHQKIYQRCSIIANAEYTTGEIAACRERLSAM